LRSVPRYPQIIKGKQVLSDNSKADSKEVMPFPQEKAEEEMDEIFLI
jgi:hypothetical protein